MNLLIFIYSLSMGGAERVTVNLANYWVEEGHSVVIVTIAPRSRDFYALHPKVKRVVLNLAHDSANPAYAFLNNMKRILALRRVLLLEKPDVALGMMVTSNILLALASRGTTIPVIGSERIHPPMLHVGPSWEKVRWGAYGFLNAVVALTASSAEWLRTHTRARKVVVIPNPVFYPLPVHKPRIQPETVLLPGRKILLAVGRLAYQKGFDRLLEAFSHVASSFPEWILAIVGDGPERLALQKMAQQLGLGHRVFFPGRVGNLHHWYQAADLYVMTSRFEGFPNTLVEAMAYGLPVVSVDCETGPRDIVRHGVDGLLVPQDDVEALVKSLAQLMQDAHLRQRMGVRAMEVRERFSLPKIADMWEKLFEEVKRKAEVR